METEDQRTRDPLEGQHAKVKPPFRRQRARVVPNTLTKRWSKLARLRVSLRRPLTVSTAAACSFGEQVLRYTDIT